MTAIMHFRSMDRRRLTAMAGVSLVHVILLLGLALAPAMRRSIVCLNPSLMFS